LAIDLKGKVLSLENKIKTEIEKLNRLNEEEKKARIHEICDLKEVHEKELKAKLLNS
jgi:hypothetical protein